MKPKLKSNRAGSAQIGRGVQHYTAFTVEFLLSARKRVRRTKITYVPTGESESWPGWDTERLTDSFIRHADLRFSAPPAASALTASTEIQPAMELAPRPDSLQLSGLSVWHGDAAVVQLTTGAEYEVQIRLAANSFNHARPQPLTYLLVVFAKELSSGARHVAAATSGWLAEGEHEIKAAGRTLPPGLYRLEACVDLISGSASAKSWLEGSLLQVG